MIKLTTGRNQLYYSTIFIFVLSALSSPCVSSLADGTFHMLTFRSMAGKEHQISGRKFLKLIDFECIFQITISNLK